MFLPFLPLIVASTTLTFFAGVLERPEQWDDAHLENTACNSVFQNPSCSVPSK